MKKCRDDPARFNDVFLRKRLPSGAYSRGRLWWRQAEIAQSIVRYRDTVVYSGNAIGKDWLVGTIVPWWLWTRRNALVIVTGPSQTLLGSVTWKEIRRAIAGARFNLKATLSQGVKASPQTLTLPDGRQALGYSTTNVERASGQHAENLLVIVEEASGVEPESWQAVDGLKYTRMLAIGNPIRPDGRFVQLIRQAEQDRRDGIDPSRAVNAIRIPSTDSPHATWDESPWGLADKTWLETQYRRYGKDSLWVRSHINAEIPVASEDSLLPEHWLDACTVSTRQKKDPRSGVPRMAIDLGEGVGRDSSVILVRDDLGILEVTESNASGLAEAASEAKRLADRWKVPHNRISYDKLGLGKAFPHHLARHGIETALPYNASAAPRQRHDYTNIRTEAAFTFRNRVDPHWVPHPHDPHVIQPPFHIPPGVWWPRLREELKAITYELHGGKTALVRKEDLVARLGHSPDLADALIQSFAF